MIKEKNLPNGWAIKPMTEVVTWGSGGTPKATESQYYDNGDIVLQKQHGNSWQNQNVNLKKIIVLLLL